MTHRQRLVEPGEGWTADWTARGVSRRDLAALRRRRLEDVCRSLTHDHSSKPLRGRALGAVGVLLVELDDDEVEQARADGHRVWEEGVVSSPVEAAPTATVPPTVPPLPGSFRLHLGRIGADQAHSRGLTGAGTLIGVLDSGIAENHSQFNGKQIHFAQFSVRGAQVPGALPHDVDPLKSHGTGVCALAAGGSLGVAPGADLAVAMVLTDQSLDGRMRGSLSQVLAGLDWLLGTTFGSRAEPGCDVINLSLELSAADALMFGARLQSRHGDIVAVAGTGNDGVTASSPAALPHVVGVGALQPDESIWPQSNQTSATAGIVKPDLWAPGADLVTAERHGAFRRDRVEGTSYASPLVAGAAALVVQRDLARAPSAIDVVNTLLGLSSPMNDGNGPGRRLSLAGL